MVKANQDIRQYIKDSKVCSWEVAEKLAIHENSLYRMLRKELCSDEKERIFQVIEQLKVEKTQ